MDIQDSELLKYRGFTDEVGKIKAFFKGKLKEYLFVVISFVVSLSVFTIAFGFPLYYTHQAGKQHWLDLIDRKVQERLTQDLSARVADVYRSISAKIVLASYPEMLNAKANKTLTELNNPEDEKILSIDVPDAVSDPEAWRKASHAQKDKATQLCKSIIENEKNIIIMVFAPWCPHCHTAMPTFSKVAESVSADTKAMIVNAESVTPELIDGGPSSLFEVSFFPMFLHKKGKDVKAVELNDIVKKADKPVNELFKRLF